MEPDRGPDHRTGKELHMGKFLDFWDLIGRYGSSQVSKEVSPRVHSSSKENGAVVSQAM